MALRVGIVGSDEVARLALVRALDQAPGSWHLSLHRTIPDDVDVLVCDPGVDAPGAVVLGGEHDDDVVARIAEAAGPGGRAVVVTSPSGGTGVTTLTLHLAAEAAARQRSTCVVDLDTAWGVWGRLGLMPPEAGGVVPVAGGFRVTGGVDRLDEVRSNFDLVLVDTPRSCLVSLSGRIRDALLVIAPTPEGARRGRVVLDEHPSFNWQVIANRPGPGGETTRSQLAAIVKLPVIELPSCAALRDSEDDRRLISRGWSRWARAVARIADGIVLAR